MIWSGFRCKYERNRMLAKLKKKGKIFPGVTYDASTVLEGDNLIQNNACINGSVVGRCSYIGFDSYLPRVSIGRFCSIGPDVRVIVGNHPTSVFVSTHGAFYSKDFFKTYITKQKYEEYSYADEGKRFFVIIGNDVWIGSNALIMNGVKIGDGAIIAAGAVVTHDVEPYSIVGGVPAKILRYRFDKETIQSLLQIEWWKRSEEWIIDHSEEFENVESFLKKLQKEEMI